MSMSAESAPATDTEVAQGSTSAKSEGNFQIFGSREDVVKTLKSLSPSNIPLPWLFINFGCFVVSIVLLFLAFLHPLAKEERVVRKMYLIYNLLTTAIWSAEVFLPTMEHERFWHAGWKTNLELFLAVYFLLDSIVIIIEWKMKKNHTTEMEADLLINVLAYSYAAREVWIMYKRQKEGFQSPEQEGFIDVA